MLPPSTDSQRSESSASRPALRLPASGRARSTKRRGETADSARSALRAEIAAFYDGFGQPEALRATVRAAALYVPLTGGDRLATFRFRGIDWVCGFTSLEEYARFMVARAQRSGTGIRPGTEYRYHTLYGWRLLDYAESQDELTGLTVDISGTAPMAFPPERAIAEGTDHGG